MSKIQWKSILFRFQRPILLIAMMVILTLALPGVFATSSNMISILFSVAMNGLMVCGAIFPVLLGGIDRTISGVAALAGAVCVQVMAYFQFSMTGFILGVILGLLVGALSGTIHGLILSRYNIPPFLMTLATVQVLYGLAQIVTNSVVITAKEPAAFTTLGTGRWFNIPVPIYLLVFFVVLSYILLNHTTYGRKVYCVGGNREASKLSGINVRAVITIAYVISGVMAAVTGIVLASMTQQAIWNAADGYENDALASMVVGGISLGGGEGSMQGAIFGVLLIGLVTNAMRLFGLSSTYHNVVKGIIIIVAVAIDMRSRYSNSGLKRNKRRLPSSGKAIQK